MPDIEVFNSFRAGAAPPTRDARAIARTRLEAAIAQEAALGVSANDRAPRPRLRTRRAAWVALIASLASLLVAASALGVGPGVGSLFGDAAPKPVKKNFALVFRGQGIDPSTIRLVALTHTSDGHILRLWTATGGAGSCVQIQVDARSPGGISCGSDTAHFGIALLEGLIPGRDTYLAGFAPPATTKIEFSFADGTTETIPVSRGAWVTSLTAARLRYGHDPRGLRALDAAGHTLARAAAPRLARKPIVATTPPIVVARYGGRPLTVAQSNLATTCIAFRRTDGVGVDTCPGTPRIGPDFSSSTDAWIVRVGPPHTFGRLILLGALRAGATRARVVYSNGHTLPARTTHGIFVLPIPRPTTSTPVRLDYLNPSGQVIKSLSLRGPKTALYALGWKHAAYKLVNFGRMNSLNYSVGPLDWPPGTQPK
jgi:hypothetical protein